MWLPRRDVAGIRQHPVVERGNNRLPGVIDWSAAFANARLHLPDPA
ncbi:MAG TPA: hypothetical protein VGE09_01610 [Pseudoxanthomonas sp.]